LRAQSAQTQHPSRATPEKGFAHARHVGTAAILRASALIASRSPLAHISPFHHRHQLHGPCIAECGIAEYAAAIHPAASQVEMDRHRSHSADSDYRLDAENPEG